MSMSDFLFLNPEINTNCSNLYAEESYCVKPVGDIATYSGYNGYNPTTTTNPVTASWADYAGSTYVAVRFNSTTTDASRANNTRTNCYYYVNGYFNYNNDTTDVYLADCYSMAEAFGTDIQTLVYLNPSLSTDNCIFDAAYSCMQLSGDDAFDGDDTSTDDDEHDDEPDTILLKLREGTLITGCKKYVTLLDGFTCQDIRDGWDLTMETFYSCNTEIGTDCSGLWPGYDYCVRTNQTIATPTPTTSTTSTSILTSISGPSAPTQTGTISTCNLWHVVVTGDSRGSLADAYSITLEQFFVWNPAVSLDCITNFWLDYDYCVGVSN